ncbi:MAG: thioredoxin family protein [Halarsenatibacteraceae bacterium]
MEIVVYGSGCKNCDTTEQRIKEVVEELGVDAKVTHDFDISSAAEKGIMLTPGVTMDGEIVNEGGVPSRDEIKKWFE